MFLIGLMPGMPAMPFFILATVLVFMWRSTRNVEGGDQLLGEEPGRETPAPEEEAAEADDDVLLGPHDDGRPRVVPDALLPRTRNIRDRPERAHAATS